MCKSSLLLFSICLHLCCNRYQVLCVFPFVRHGALIVSDVDVPAHLTGVSLCVRFRYP